MVNDNNSKQQFHEALAFLIESANINSGILTMEEIKSALDDIITDDSMYQLVYDYLLENKISIKGYIQHKKPRTDENEEATFPTMLEETEKIESYVKKRLQGHVCCIYGCSLGGSLVGLLAQRHQISFEHGILGSSDLDQEKPLHAKISCKIRYDCTSAKKSDQKRLLGKNAFFFWNRR